MHPLYAQAEGLKETSIEITSLGEPEYIAGNTPAVRARTYVRFIGENGSVTTAITTGRDNPTSASSEAPGHSGRLANDGDPTTIWQAAAADTNAWLRVDLERIVTANKFKLTFPTKGAWRYKIEISEDGVRDWRLVTDQTRTPGTDRVRTDTVASGSVHGRFVRVTVTETPPGQCAAIAEVEVSGRQ